MPRRKTVKELEDDAKRLEAQIKVEVLRKKLEDERKKRK